MSNKKFQDMINNANSLDDLVTALDTVAKKSKKSKNNRKIDIDKSKIAEQVKHEEVEKNDVNPDAIEHKRTKGEIYSSSPRHKTRPDPGEIFISDPPQKKEIGEIYFSEPSHKTKPDPGEIFISDPPQKKEIGEIYFSEPSHKTKPDPGEIFISDPPQKQEIREIHFSEPPKKPETKPIYMSKGVKKTDPLPDLKYSGKPKERRNVAAIEQHQEQEIFDKVPSIAAAAISKEDFSAYFDECVKSKGKMTETTKARKQMGPGEGYIDIYERLKEKARETAPVVYYDAEEGKYNVFLGSACLVSISPVDIYMKDRIKIAKNLDKRMNTSKKGKNVDLSVYMALDKYDSIFNTSARESYVRRVMGLNKSRNTVRVNYDLSNANKNRKMNMFMKSLIEKYAEIHEKLGMGMVQRKTKVEGQHLKLGYER